MDPRRKYAVSLFPFLYMTQAGYSPSGAARIITDEEKINESELEKRIRQDKVPSRPAGELRKGAKSINYFSDVYKDFKESGKLSDLQDYLSNVGYKSDVDVKLKESSNRNPQAVAYTDGRSTFGVNNRFNEAVSNIAKSGKLEKWAAEEYIIAHELTHMAQPDKTKSNVYSAESDVELKLAQYFHNKSKGEKDSNTAEQYQKAAEMALGRYIGITRGALGNPKSEKKSSDRSAYIAILAYARR